MMTVAAASPETALDLPARTYIDTESGENVAVVFREPSDQPSAQFRRQPLLPRFPNCRSKEAKTRTNP